MNNLQDDLGLMTIKMAVAAVGEANKTLAQGKSLTPGQPFTVPHTLFHGPAGTGKTLRALEAAKLMGCTEENNTFIAINADTIKNIEDFINILISVVNYEGYRCNNGKCSHKGCGTNHKFYSLEQPQGPFKPVAIFMDEIHLLSKDLQEKLGLILLDFKYAIQVDGKVKTLHFPKFTFFAATTIPGNLMKSLRTRFANKVAVNYYTDEQMKGIVETMAQARHLVLDDACKEIVARVAQGVAREAENHLRGVFNCWSYLKQSNQASNREVITAEVAKYYIKNQQYLEDGLSLNQIRVLSSLFKGSTKSRAGLGLNRLCALLGMDSQQYLEDVEPRLVYRQYITSGSKGREITEEGKEYLTTLFAARPELAENL